MDTFEDGVATQEGFRVTDESSAEWVLSKRADALTAIARIEENAAKAKHPYEQTVAQMNFHLPEIEEIARQKMDADNHGRKKPVKYAQFLHGRVGWRTVKGGVRVADEEAALAWARQNLPGAVKVVESVSKTALKDVLAENAPVIKETGEAVEWAEVVEDRESVYIQ